MNAVQRIAKNITVLLLARIVSMLFGFLRDVYCKIFRAGKF